MFDYEEEQRNRRHKRSKAKTPKKANHKHIFEPCVIEYNYPYGKLEEGRGFQTVRKERIDGYCPICGKIGTIDMSRWYKFPTLNEYEWGRKTELSDEAIQELDPATRTLPTFDVGDDWLFPKFVNLEG